MYAFPYFLFEHYDYKKAFRLFRKHRFVAIDVRMATQMTYLQATDAADVSVFQRAVVVHDGQTALSRGLVVGGFAVDSEQVRNVQGRGLLGIQQRRQISKK